MREIYEQKIIDVRTGRQGVEGMDIMGSLVKSALGEQSHDDASKASISRAEKGQTSGLTEAEIFGNSFIMILAGHETTANIIHFAIMELAMNPSSQRRVQEEVDSIFGGSAPNDWDYESCINTCLGGMLGAVLNETLRLMSPVVNIPKSVRPDRDQNIVVDGRKVILPKGSLININTVAVHRNPKYWPSLGVSKISDRPDDLDDFIPERWLVKGHSKESEEAETLEEPEEENFGGFTGTDTARQLFCPARSAFVPFSYGPRSCLGRRLAQIEVVAVLAVIFQQYSIELAVDEWATDDEVAKMFDNGKVELYKKAQKQARKVVSTVTSRLTLKLHDSPRYIPVRIARRGEERFINLIE
jgi:cytochrome P450